MVGSLTDTVSTFDLGKQIRFVAPFQETEVDKYFKHFKKIAASLKWPKHLWTVLLQSVLIGKAQEIYSALPVNQSANYLVVKEAVLKTYELVPKRTGRSSGRPEKKKTWNLLGQRRDFSIDAVPHRV